MTTLNGSNENASCHTFGNTQPLLFLCEAAKGSLQSLGHHLFTSWSKQGDISALRICQSQLQITPDYYMSNINMDLIWDYIIVMFIVYGAVIIIESSS